MRKLFFILCCIIASNGMNGQQKIDFEFMSKICAVPKPHNHWVVAKNNKNGVQHVFSFLFLGYKAFFSSQDNNHCSFEPSCSEYAIYSLKKHGFFIGVMAACDRLLRCNGLNAEQYEYNEVTELLIDNP